MRPRRVRSLPPIRTWTERIDERVIVGMAICRETRPYRTWDPDTQATLIRRALYAIDAWVLVPRELGDRSAYAWLDRARCEAEAELVRLCPRGPHSLRFLGICEDSEP